VKVKVVEKILTIIFINGKDSCAIEMRLEGTTTIFSHVLNFVNF